VIGALLALARDWPRPVIGLVLGFGAGALVSAVSFELAQEGVEIGGRVPVAVGVALGAATYYVADGLIERGTAGSSAGTGLALGAFLDGIPEQLVLGIGLAGGEPVSVGLLAAIFVSNLPEAMGSAGDMRAAGRPPRAILRLWLAVAAICTLASCLGFGAADTASDELHGGINGFAAGALLVMLVGRRLIVAATPPPITKPATAAPTRAAWRFSASWRRQFVSSPTFERRSLTENASSCRVDSIECRISAGERVSVTIARSGVGGAPRLMNWSASRPARMPSSSSATAVTP
jgi:ZIP family zinc transporter